MFAPHTQDPKVEYVGDLIALPSVNAPFRPEYKFSLPITNKYWRILREFSPTIVHVTSPDVVGFEAEVRACQIFLSVANPTQSLADRGLLALCSSGRSPMASR